MKLYLVFDIIYFEPIFYIVFILLKKKIPKRLYISQSLYQRYTFDMLHKTAFSIHQYILWTNIFYCFYPSKKEKHLATINQSYFTSQLRI